MGRRPTNKERKNNTAKKDVWVANLFPYFKNNGFMGFSMDDVASFLGVSKATIYNHFASKDEIIDYYLDKKIEDFNVFTEALEDNSLTLIHRYENALRYLVSQMVDVSPRVRSDLEISFPEKWNLFQQMLNKALSQLGDHYRQGIEDGIFLNVNVDLLLLCDKDMLMFISDEQKLIEGNVDPALAFEQYMHIRKNGLLKAPGLM